MRVSWRRPDTLIFVDACYALCVHYMYAKRGSVERGVEGGFDRLQAVVHTVLRAFRETAASVWFFSVVRRVGFGR